MKFAYLDSSVILRRILHEPFPKTPLNNYESFFTSEITDVECHRALDRVRINEHLPEEELATCYAEFKDWYSGFEIIKVNSDIFQRAKESFPVLVRTLDAIHLSSLLFVREYLFPNAVWTFISHDKRQLNAAKTLGFEVDS